MIDWEQLERELADDGFGAGDGGSAAARRRERRQLAAVAALAVVLLAALVVPVCVVVLRGHTVGGNQRATRPDPTSAPATAPQTVAAIYAAAIAGGAPTPLAHDVRVNRAVCATVPAPPDGRGCVGEPIPLAVQRRVRAVLGPRVTFASDPPVSYRATGTVVVFLGRLVVAGNRARLGVDTLCGALCGQGETLVLHRAHGMWQVTGTVGPRWVS